ncbi:MAG: sulfite exporter TauE/SafE family protein [Burkholderiales bacterium]|nr:sulfite exporter TauE/SafE family protein [Burkholderiales bacterium]
MPVDELSLWQILFCVGVVTVAFAVRGGTGFGGGAVAVPLLALVFPVPVTVPVVTVLNMLSSVGHGVLDWRHIVWREIWRILPGSLLGVFVGIYLLTLIDPQPLARALGVFVVLYALYVMVFSGRTLAIPPRWMLPVAGVTSFSAGIVGSLFGGAAGPIYVIYLNAARLGKDAFRVTITMVMLFQGLTRVAGYATLGLYDRNVMLLLAAALPMMIIGSWLGARLVRRIDQQLFQRVLGVVLLVSGTALALK